MQRRSGGRGLGAVLFTDIVGSTAIAAEMGNTRWSELVARHHRVLRRLIGRFGGHEVDTAGDGFFVTFERPADAIRCAVAATEAVRELGIEVRAGVAFGELETAGRKPSGLVVNTAARVMAVAGPGEVLVPGSVKEIVPGTGISFVEHGVHRLKGLDEEFRLHVVTGVDGHEVEPPLEEAQAAERRREIFPTGGRRRALLVGAGAGALALVAAALLIPGLLGDGEGPATDPVTHAVARIDASTGAIGSSIPVTVPTHWERAWEYIEHPLAAGEGGVWLLRPPSLLRIDPLHEEVRADLIHVGLGQSLSVETGFDAVWALNARTVFRVHPGTGEVREALVLPVPTGITTWSFALGRDLWVGVSDGTLVRLDPSTEARDQVDTGLSIDGVAVTMEAVWVVDILAGALYRFDAGSLQREGPPIEIRGSVDEMVAGDDDVWVLDRRIGIVTLIDGTSNVIRGTVRVGDDATDLAVDEAGVWVSDEDGSLYHIDASTMEPRRLSFDAEVLGVAVDDADGSVWVYLGDAVERTGG